jgi:hypothetical protein
VLERRDARAQLLAPGLELGELGFACSSAPSRRVMSSSSDWSTLPGVLLVVLDMGWLLCVKC